MSSYFIAREACGLSSQIDLSVRAPFKLNNVMCWQVRSSEHRKRGPRWMSLPQHLGVAHGEFDCERQRSAISNTFPLRTPHRKTMMFFILCCSSVRILRLEIEEWKSSEYMSGAGFYAWRCVLLYTVAGRVMCAQRIAKRSDGLVSLRGREIDDQGTAGFYNGKKPVFLF